MDNAAVILETVKKVRTEVINFYRHLIINQTENKENHQRFYFPDIFHWQIEDYFTKFFDCSQPDFLVFLSCSIVECAGRIARARRQRETVDLTR